MAFQPKLNSGGLFKNTRNTKSDMTGSIQIECARCHATSDFWMNAWNKISQGGLEYIQVALKLKAQNATAPGADHGNRA
jgi:hypothetical protein